jgi:hypothetical protein
MTCDAGLLNLSFSFNEPLKLLSNPQLTLVNPLFLWKTASVDTVHFLISTCPFPKLTDLSEYVSHCCHCHSLFLLVEYTYCYSQIPTVDSVALHCPQTALRKFGLNEVLCVKKSYFQKYTE